jgi:hypothetical protein
MTKYIETTQFFFDKVFDENSKTENIYEIIVSPLVDHFLNNGNCTCLAYGIINI